MVKYSTKGFSNKGNSVNLNNLPVINAIRFEQACTNMFFIQDYKAFLIMFWQIELKFKVKIIRFFVRASPSRTWESFFVIIIAQNTWTRTFITSINLMLFNCFANIHRIFSMFPNSQIRVHNLTCHQACLYFSFYWNVTKF